MFRVGAAAALLLVLASGARAEVIDDAKAAVTAKLKDPQSALFSDVRVSSDPNVVCGKVNAKNSFGGYVGAKEFRYFINGKSALIVGGFPITGRYEDEMAQPFAICRSGQSS